jgi:hypothetical protein
MESAKIVAAVARMVRDIGVAEELAQDALVAALTDGDSRGAAFNAAALVATGRARIVLEAGLRVAHLAHPAYARAILTIASGFKPRTASHSADLVATCLTAIRGRAPRTRLSVVPVDVANRECDDAGCELLGRLPASPPPRWRPLVSLCVTAALSGVAQEPPTQNAELRALLEEHRSGRIAIGGGAGAAMDTEDLKLCALWTHAGMATARQASAGARHGDEVPRKVVFCPSSTGDGPEVTVIAVPR